MERNEQATLVARAERIALVKGECHGGPVAGKGKERVPGRGATADLLPVATILRSKNLLLVLIAVIAVRPAVVIASADSHQLLARIVRVHLVAEAPIVAQLIPTVHRSVERTGSRLGSDTDRVPESGGIPASVAKALSGPAGRELPNAGTGFQFGAWIVSG